MLAFCLGTLYKLMHREVDGVQKGSSSLRCKEAEERHTEE